MGKRTHGKAGLRFLREAIAAYDSALQVYSEHALPQQWAMTQINLGNAQSTAGNRMGGADGATLLAGATGSYAAAVRVYNRIAHPLRWATIQNNLGNALGRLPADDYGYQLQKAVGCYQKALMVFTLDTAPGYHRTTKRNLGVSQKNFQAFQSVHVSPDDPATTRRLLTLQLDFGNDLTAEHTLPRLIALAPSNPSTRTSAPRLSWGQGERVQAIQHLGKALALNPDHPEGSALRRLDTADKGPSKPDLSTQ